MGSKYILRRSLLPLALLLAAMTVATAEAHEGFYLSAEMVFVDIGGTTNAGYTISPGDGAGIIAGYGIGRHFAVEASMQKTAHAVSDGRQIELTAALVGVKVLYPLADSHMEPYLVLGIGKYTLDTGRGDGWRGGAGLDIRLTQAFTLSVSIARHFLDLAPAQKTSGDVTSMNIGIAYHFL